MIWTRTLGRRSVLLLLVAGAAASGIATLPLGSSAKADQLETSVKVTITNKTPYPLKKAAAEPAAFSTWPGAAGYVPTKTMGTWTSEPASVIPVGGSTSFGAKQNMGTAGTWVRYILDGDPDQYWIDFWTVVPHQAAVRNTSLCRLYKGYRAGNPALGKQHLVAFPQASERYAYCSKWRTYPANRLEL